MGGCWLVVECAVQWKIDRTDSFRTVDRKLAIPAVASYPNKKRISGTSESKSWPTPSQSCIFVPTHIQVAFLFLYVNSWSILFAEISENCWVISNVLSPRRSSPQTKSRSCRLCVLSCRTFAVTSSTEISCTNTLLFQLLNYVLHTRYEPVFPDYVCAYCQSWPLRQYYVSFNF